MEKLKNWARSYPLVTRIPTFMVFSYFSWIIIDEVSDILNYILPSPLDEPFSLIHYNPIPSAVLITYFCYLLFFGGHKDDPNHPSTQDKPTTE